MSPLPTGGTIGIVGGGQLGRMMAMAAARLGYRCHIYAPQERPCAADVSARFTRGSFDDEAALAAFGRSVDVATYEFENISAVALAALADAVPLHPPRAALEIAQDRIAEKDFAKDLGGRPAPYRAVDDLTGRHAALDALGTPAILKTRRLGYDGKGQARIMTPSDAEAAWNAVAGRPCVLEAMVDFEAEFSVILCRAADGSRVSWTPTRNEHRDGILARATLPAGAIIEAQAPAARDLAIRIADALDYVGVLTCEFFAGCDGPVFNEMAPRVHNSGHWTIEGAVTSQFENHIRAICGLPLGSADATASGVEMTNLIGGNADVPLAELLSGGHVHLYGKGHARPGRKMGHVTRILR